MCEAGRILVDGRVARDPASRPSLEQAVTVNTAASRHPAEPSLLVHFDREIVVVRKPVGILSVPFERGDRDTLLSLTRVALGRADRQGSPMLRAVQRLDRESSGLVVFARSLNAQRRLQEQFRDHSVLRIYRALAHGTVEPATFETLLVRDRGDGLRGTWRPDAGEPPTDARWALTHVEVRQIFQRTTLIDCRIETGRQHQIRIHLAEDGHPLVGETVYVRDYPNRLIAAPRLMLHAQALGFKHPRTGAPLHFEERPPEDFENVVKSMRRR
jgi:23S rRNA pseudouridine1911/1915/1917 synthase